MVKSIAKGIAFCTLISLALGGCQRRQPDIIDRKYLPPHTLATIVGELKIYQSVDFYRFGFPETPAGQNVFKATLKRLDNFENLYPDEMVDIVSFCRALALEKVGKTDEAALYYEKVMQDESSPLVKEAQERLAMLREINNLLFPQTTPSTLQASIVLLEQQVYGLNRLVNNIENAEYEPLLMYLRENVQMEYALLLKNHHAVLEEGIKKATAIINVLIEENPESARFWAHKLMLADFYFELAKEYTILIPPGSLEFSTREFLEFAETARQLYYETSLADGFHEKLEAKYKLSAISEFIDATVDKAI